MSNIKAAIDSLYYKKNSLIILGLTGRTGSGCSTVSSIIKAENFDKLNLSDPKSYDYSNTDERKYNIIYKFMKSESNWKPFTIIEASAIIFSYVLDNTYEDFILYLDKLHDNSDKHSFHISDYDALKEKLKGIQYLFNSAKQFDISGDISNIIDPETEEEIGKLKKFYKYFITTIPKYRDSLKNILSDYSCFDCQKSRLGESRRIKSQLYTYLMQSFGNNIRSSGNPFSNIQNDTCYFWVAERIDKIISIIIAYDKFILKGNSTRICIDAIRNPFEAFHFKCKYGTFYLVSVNTDDAALKKRLEHLDKQELESLNAIEYPQKLNSDSEVFFHQNISGCLEVSDIHLYNPQVDNKKYRFLSEQILKYIALILHPGLITPSHIERCMQLAYNTKLNSGCLSRQVGAVITDSDYSIKAIGWNDVPGGQVPCILRDIHNLCVNKDPNSHSDYEVTDSTFLSVMSSLDQSIDYNKLNGRLFPYCFKDIYNCIKGEPNQVHTRALHAEENAFLQITKYGGHGISGGYLFTTASPCELCSKKAYQLGISEIYYIDPYPGISQKHILKFGEGHNPNMNLFYGAIGSAYVSLYSALIPTKDEIRMLSNIDCKKAKDYSKFGQKIKLGIDEVRYEEVESTLVFNSREDIYCIRKVKMKILKQSIGRLDKKTSWTGSSFDEVELLSSSKKCNLINTQTERSPYEYSLIFEESLAMNETVEYEIKISVKDEGHIMNPFFAYLVDIPSDKIKLSIKVPDNYIENVNLILYADLDMKTRFKQISDNIAETRIGTTNQYSFETDDPNLFYSYCFEWNFKK